MNAITYQRSFEGPRIPLGRILMGIIVVALLAAAVHAIHVTTQTTATVVAAFDPSGGELRSSETLIPRVVLKWGTTNGVCKVVSQFFLGRTLKRSYTVRSRGPCEKEDLMGAFAALVGKIQSYYGGEAEPIYMRYIVPILTEFLQRIVDF